ncbi:MAG: hypothetical protein RMJ28_06620 [Nitrososphaerota archaeon]|nr:hypothetical protein [Candidatus Calditenuaceae archaeon]MDW8073888.1 hypothetical protein [Nitrososphaerota archaeon]
MRRKRGYSEIVSTVLILAAVLSAGIALWVFLSSYAGVWRQEEVRQLGDQALILRSNIGAEYVYYPDKIFGGADRGVMLLRNTGREPVIVFRILTIKNGTVVYDSGIDDHARIPVNERTALAFRCPGSVCSPGDRILVQVHYIPEQLYDPDNPALSKPDSETLLFKVATFEASEPRYGLASGCELPTNHWLLIELVDPKEENIYGVTTDFIKVRLLNASRRMASYDFQVTVTDANGVVARGTARVTGDLPQEVYVQLDRGGLRTPLVVEIQSLMPDVTILPQSWGFPSSFGNYIDYSKMRLNLNNMRIDEMILSIGFWEDGDYELVVEIYDCNNVLIARGILRVQILMGGLSLIINQYSVVLDTPVYVFDIGRVVVRTMDVTPIITTTTTSTVTETVTMTTTRVTTTTIPRTTTTTVSTIVSTSTTVTPSTTRTVPETVTRVTTVVVSTGTHIVIRTTTSFTATRTSTITSVVTVVRTSFSPTITNTVTSVSTTFTTTRTLTSTFTSTVYVTSTVTSRTTSTTTVGGGSGQGSGEAFIFVPHWWPLGWQVMLYLSLGPLVVYPLIRRWVNSWIRE